MFQLDLGQVSVASVASFPAKSHQLLVAGQIRALAVQMQRCCSLKVTKTPCLAHGPLACSVTGSQLSGCCQQPLAALDCDRSDLKCCTHQNHQLHTLPEGCSMASREIPVSTVRIKAAQSPPQVDSNYLTLNPACPGRMAGD